MTFAENVKQTLNELSLVADRLDAESISALIDEIMSAHKIVLAGVGREGLATRFFAMRLMHLGFDSHWLWDDTAPGAGAGDLVIMTNGSGEIPHLDVVAEAVKTAGATLVVVTGVPTGRTAQRADRVVFVPASVYKGEGNLVPSKHPMGTLFEQSVLITFDEIVLLLAERLGITHAEMADRHRNYE